LRCWLRNNCGKIAAVQKFSLLPASKINDGFHWVLYDTWPVSGEIMSKEKTLEAVQDDIAQGNLGRARDRLHGLIAHYPNELTLRTHIAEIYSQLQYPSMAGRYWYLEESKTERMISACAEFERSCGNDPLQILLSLKFKGNIEAITSTFAKEKLQSLQQTCKDKYGIYLEYGSKGAARWKRAVREKVSNVIVSIVIITILGLFVFLAGTGIVTVISWF